MKEKLRFLPDVLFILILGILFTIIPSKMVKWVGLIVGIYFILKGVVQLIAYKGHPLSMFPVVLNIILGIICVLLWGLFVKFIMLLLGLILLGHGISTLSNPPTEDHKPTLKITIISVLEAIFGGTIFVVSLFDAGEVLGIITGIILIILSILLFIENFKKDDHEHNNNSEYVHVETTTEVIDAEIIDEKHTDL